MLKSKRADVLLRRAFSALLTLSMVISCGITSFAEDNANYEETTLYTLYDGQCDENGLSQTGGKGYQTYGYVDNLFKTGGVSLIKNQLDTTDKGGSKNTLAMEEFKFGTAYENFKAGASYGRPFTFFGSSVYDEKYTANPDSDVKKEQSYEKVGVVSGVEGTSYAKLNICIAPTTEDDKCKVDLDRYYIALGLDNWSDRKFSNIYYNLVPIKKYYGEGDIGQFKDIAVPLSAFKSTTAGGEAEFGWRGYEKKEGKDGPASVNTNQICALGIVYCSKEAPKYPENPGAEDGNFTYWSCANDLYIGDIEFANRKRVYPDVPEDILIKTFYNGFTIDETADSKIKEYGSDGYVAYQDWEVVAGSLQINGSSVGGRNNVMKYEVPTTAVYYDEKDKKCFRVVGGHLYDYERDKAASAGDELYPKLDGQSWDTKKKQGRVAAADLTGKKNSAYAVFEIMIEPNGTGNDWNAVNLDKYYLALGTSTWGEQQVVQNLAYNIIPIKDYYTTADIGKFKTIAVPLSAFDSPNKGGKATGTITERKRWNNVKENTLITDEAKKLPEIGEPLYNRVSSLGVLYYNEEKLVETGEYNYKNFAYIGNLSIVDSKAVFKMDSEKITEVAKDGTVTAATYSLGESGKCIAARYDAGGSLIEIQTADISPKMYSKNSFDFNCKAGDEIKLFKWDSLGTMKPVAKPQGIADAKKKLILVGDSLCQGYASQTEYSDDTCTTTVPVDIRGFGELMQDRFDPDRIEVVNVGFGGYSAMTFMEPDNGDGKAWANYDGNFGSWERIKSKISKGDTVLIVLGINDNTHIGNAANRPSYTWTMYENYLKQMVADTKALNATPVLVSPVVGVSGTSFSWQAPAEHIKNAANETNTTYLPLGEALKEKHEAELTAKGTEYFADGKMTEKGAKYIRDTYHTYGRTQVNGKFVRTSPKDENGEFIKDDGTHTNEAGATLARDTMLELLKKTNLSIGKRVK